MSDRDKRVHCNSHGSAVATFVCQHVHKGKDLGFCLATDPDDPWPDAWCNACDEALEANGWKWNDEIEKKMHVVAICNKCYERVRNRNSRATRSLKN